MANIINSGLFALGRIRYTTENVAGYGLSLSGSVTFKDILTTEGTGNVLIEPLKNEAMKQRIDDMERTINGRRRCDMSLTTWLNGTGVSASMGMSQSLTNNNYLLAAVMGGVAQGITQEVITPDNSYHFYTNQSGSDFAQLAGIAVGIINPSTGLLETARIRNSDTATGEIYLSNGLQFTPAANAVVQSSVTNFLTQDTYENFITGDSTGSLQFQVQRAGTTDNFVMMGLNGGFSLSTELGQLPSISYKFDGGANWITGSNAEELAVADYSGESEPPALIDGFFKFFPYSTDVTTASTSSIIDIFSAEIVPNITYADIPSERGVNNILRKRRQRAVPVATGKFVTYMNDQTYYNAWRDRTPYVVEFQIGNTVGNTVMISCPRVQITSVTQTDAGGMDGQEVSFECYEDLHSGNASGFPEEYFPQTDMYRSALSFFFL